MAMAKKQPDSRHYVKESPRAVPDPCFRGNVTFYDCLVDKHIFGPSPNQD